MPKGPNGRALCRMCGTETPGNRTTFCSPECVHEWRLLSDPGYLREQVWKRDRGGCALCEAQCERHHLNRWQRFHGEKQGKVLGPNWQADHIVPLAEGGTNSLDNVRTLCTACHAKVTGELHRRLAERARHERDLQKLEAWKKAQTG